ncbi:MAG: putative Ig domain-containing protein [Verrucomicrobiota bacterium]
MARETAPSGISPTNSAQPPTTSIAPSGSLSANTGGGAPPPAQWESRGLGAGGGMYGPTISPHDPNVMFLTCDMSEVFRSRDGGLSWVTIDFTQLTVKPEAEIQFTSDPQILYAHDVHRLANESVTSRPVKSIDGGDHWTPCPGWPAKVAGWRIYADPNRTDRVVMGSIGALYTSNDGGTTFQSAFNFSPVVGANGGRLCGAFFDDALNANGKNDLFVGSNSGLLISTDNGVSFTVATIPGLPAGHGMTSFAGAKDTVTGRIRFYCITASAAVIKMQTTAENLYTHFSGVYRLDWDPNQSMNWVAVNNGIDARDQPGFVAMSPRHPDVAYLAANRLGLIYPDNCAVYKLNTAGNAWTSVLRILTNANVVTGWGGVNDVVGNGTATSETGVNFSAPHGFGIDPKNPERLIVTDSAMAHISADGGNVWRQIYIDRAYENPAGTLLPHAKAYKGNGLEPTVCYWVEWMNRTSLWAGFNDIKMIHSGDGGFTWSFNFKNRSLPSGDAYQILYHASSGTLYAINPFLISPYQEDGVDDAQVDGTGVKIGTGGVYFLPPNSQGWLPLKIDFGVAPGSPTGTKGAAPVWLALDPYDPEKLYVSIANSDPAKGGVYVTSNLSAGANATWIKLPDPVNTPPSGRSTEGHPYNVRILKNNRLVVSYSGRQIGDESGPFTPSSGVFYSADGGQTWEDRSDPGMHYYVQDVVIDPHDPAENTWYACVWNTNMGIAAQNNGGLYKTTNAGLNWTRLIAGPSITSCTINPDPALRDEMFVCSHYAGLFHTSNVNDPSPQFNAVSSYPFRGPNRVFYNPFNPSEIWVTSNGNGLRVGVRTAASTLEFAAAQLTVNENASTIAVPVQRIGSTSGSVSVDFRTGDSTATSPKDFTAVAGSLTWADGDAAPKQIVIPIVDNPEVDGTRTLTVTLENASAGATLGQITQTQISILDDDTDGNLFTNGSFEQGLQTWITPLPGLVQYSISPDAHDGAQSARVANRSVLGHSMQQDLNAALSAAMNGARYTTRFWVKLDAPASVRGVLDLVDDAGSTHLILAEQVVRSPNVWIEITGTKVIGWSGAIRSATFTLEIGQVPENSFPAYQVDAVRMQPDADGDLIPDYDERVAGTNPQSSDTDGDGLPDGWEVENQLDPNKADGSSDPDQDGFTNLQEYWAAVNPRDKNSFPGKTANPQASREAKAVLQYLSLLPSSPAHRLVVGQHLTDTVPEYTNLVVRLAQLSGRWVGLLSLSAEGQTQPLQISSVVPYALDQWTNGGLVLIKWAVWNPWTKKYASDLDQNSVDIPGLLDPASSAPANLATNQSAQQVYFGWLDEVAASLAELRDAGVVVLWRPMSEMNGGWFWWGRARQADYIALWRHMHDYFTRVKGLHNLLWVYESDSGVHPGVPSDYYVPGDDVVDVVGHNFYHDTWNLSFDSELIYRRYGKVYGFPQAGPSKQHPRDGSFDNLIYLDGIINRYPLCSFIAVWNSFSTAGGTATSKLAIVDNQHFQELLEHPLTVTRENVAWKPFIPLSINSDSKLPEANVGIAFQYRLASDGGTPPYLWSIDAGSIPGGLRLSTDGIISGTPTQSGVFNFTLKLADDTGALVRQDFSLTILPPPLAILTAPDLPAGMAGAVYSQVFTATGGTLPYAWAHSNGNLPIGLTFDSSGKLSGTPAESGTFNFDIQVNDASNQNVTRSFTLFVASSPLVITTPSVLASSTVGVAYQQNLSATGGSGAYVWTLFSGALPGGLDLAPEGRISGIPTAAGFYDFTVQVTDALNSTARKTIFLVVHSPPIVISTPPNLPPGQIGVPYTKTFEATGGNAPFTWSVAAGNLPQGMTLSSEGILSGTPLEFGTFVFQILLHDITGQLVDSPFSLVIAPPPLVISNTAVPDGVEGDLYSHQFTATGGVPPYVWSLVSGNAPAQMSFTADGVLTGIPGASGAFGLVVRVTDSVGVFSEHDFTFNIHPPPPPGNIQVESEAYTIAENGGSIEIKLLRINGSAGQVSVELATEDGAAMSGADYQQTNAMVVWPDGDSSPKSVAIPILDDLVFEGNEQFQVALRSPSGGASLVSPDRAMVTIVENDLPPVGSIKLGAAVTTAHEGSTLNLSIMRVGGSAQGISVRFEITGGTALPDLDYRAASGEVAWPDGDASPRTVELQLLADSIAEGDETVNFVLSNPTGGATLDEPAVAIITIRDRPVDDWRFRHFASEANRPEISGDGADPDGDGLPNLAEYAFALDPRLASRADLPSGSLHTVGGGEFLALRFRRAALAEDVLFVVEISDDLMTWIPGSRYFGGTATGDTEATLEVERTPGPVEFVTVRDKTPLSQKTRRFMRINLSRP